MEYHYYRLQRSEGNCNSQATGIVCRFNKHIELTLRKCKCSGNDPILVFDFFTRLVEESSTPAMTEGEAFISLPYFFTGHASRQFSS